MPEPESSTIITLYSDVRATHVRWLWNPFIAIGKITLLQGDPGDGKSTMMMNLIAEISNGGATPDGQAFGRPQRVIYQCSEDGVSDTIKPRLEACGADCRNVAFINEEVHSGLTLDDERIREAIIGFRPRLVVIDPIQAYLGSDSDLQIAGRARRLMQRLSLWASTYDCAVVLVGHLNKKEGSKRTQYRQRDHHEAIVSREVYNAANHMMASRTYSGKSKPLPVLSVIDDGVLRGFVPVDKDWRGFSAEDYTTASESVYHENEQPAATFKPQGVNMAGYTTIRGEFFPTLSAPAMTITRGKLRFNTACLNKFQDVEYVELLLNSVNHRIAIRPCEKDNPNAIHWGKLREERWCVNEVGCKGFAGILFGLMSWDDDTRYKFRGQFIERDHQKVLLFELDEPEMLKCVERAVPVPPSEEEDNAEQQEEIVVRETIRVLPPAWLDSFGDPVMSVGTVNLLNRIAVDDEWDVLRPAKEMEDMNILTCDQLDDLMKEAEEIMTGWDKNMEGSTENGKD